MSVEVNNMARCSRKTNELIDIDSTVLMVDVSILPLVGFGPKNSITPSSTTIDIDTPKRATKTSPLKDVQVK